MDYTETRQQMMDQFPEIFPDEIAVLNHLFFVNGNGYDWSSGQLVDNCGEETDEQLAYLREKDQETRKVLENLLDALDAADRVIGTRTNSELRRHIKSEIARKSGDPMKVREAVLKENERKAKAGLHGFSIKPNGSVCRDLYPICGYASIMNLPDDIKPDWLGAAMLALECVKLGLLYASPKDMPFIREAEVRIAQLKTQA